MFYINHFWNILWIAVFYSILFYHVLCSPLQSSWVSPLSWCYRDSAINLNVFQVESVLPLDGGQPCMKYVLPVMHCWCMCVCVCLFMHRKMFLFSWPNTTDVLESEEKQELLLVTTELNRQIQDLNILTFMNLCMYVFSIQYENIQIRADFCMH